MVPLFEFEELYLLTSCTTVEVCCDVALLTVTTLWGFGTTKVFFFSPTANAENISFARFGGVIEFVAPATLARSVDKGRDPVRCVPGLYVWWKIVPKDGDEHRFCGGDDIP